MMLLRNTCVDRESARESRQNSGLANQASGGIE